MNKIYLPHIKPASRRFIADVLAFVVGVALLVGCAVGSSSPSPSSSPLTVASSVATPRWVASPGATVRAASSAAFQLTVLHTNDTWGYLAPCG